MTPERTMYAGRLEFHICDTDFAGGFGCRHFFVTDICVGHKMGRVLYYMYSFYIIFCNIFKHYTKAQKIFQKCYIS